MAISRIYLLYKIDLLVTVNSEGGPAVHTKELGQVVSDTLGADKDQHLGILLRDLLEVLDELAALVKVGTDLDDLLDVVVGGKFERTDVDLDKVLLEVGSEALNLFGPGGREQERLTVGTDLRDNLADLRLETHVQHAVGFVHDEIGDAAQVGLAGFEHVDETTGSGNANLDTSLQIADLGALGGTTVNGSVADAGRFAEFGAFSLNLDGEFTSRGEDQDNGSVTGRKEGLGVDVHHGGKSERDGLAGTGLRDADNVTTRQGHGPGLALDGRRGGETQSADLGEDVLGEAGFVEGSDGAGNVLAVEGHFLLGAELVDLALRTGGNAFILNVEAACQSCHLSRAQ